MSIQEEEYAHFTSCIEELNSAWRILQDIKKSKDEVLIGYAFRYALIQYAKPYKQSFGKEKRKHQLESKFVPKEHSEMHKKILDVRDTILAHSDLTVKDIKVCVGSINNEKYVSTPQNIIYGINVNAIDGIIDLIERTLDSMYNEEKRLEKLLPINSLK